VLDVEESEVTCSRGVHRRDEIDRDVTAACRLQSDKRLDMFQEVDLIVEALARVRVDGQVQRPVRSELAATACPTHISKCILPQCVIVGKG